MRAPVLGIVVNGVSEKRSYYSFGYGYGLPGSGTLPGPGEPIEEAPRFELAPDDGDPDDAADVRAPWSAHTS
jgi:hypothetical protein